MLNIKYTPVEDIIVSQTNYDLVIDGEEVEYDGVVVTTPHQTFMKWFEHDRLSTISRQWILHQLQQ